MSPPYNPPKSCFQPGCPNVTHKTYCDKHSVKHSRIYDKSRGNAAARGYDYHWQKERTAHLMRNPLCIECMKSDKITAAIVVDHIIPHKGNMKLFWDQSNWQSLCVSCHNSKSAKEKAYAANKKMV